MIKDVNAVADALQDDTENTQTPEETPSTEESNLLDEKATEDSEGLFDDEKSDKDDAAQDEEADKKTDDAPGVYKKPEIEGYSISDERFGAISEVAKKHSIPQEALSEFLDLDAKTRIEDSEAAKNASAQNLKAYKQENMTALRNEYKDGFRAAEMSAKAAFDAFFDDETKGFLRKSGLLTDPGVFRALNKIGSKISDTSFVDGDKKVSDKSNRTLAQALDD